MNIRSLLGLLALSCLLFFPSRFAPAAEPKVEKKGKPDYKITIFDDEHLKGKNLIVRQSVPNLSELKFIDSSGLGVLLRFHNAMVTANRPYRVIPGPPHVHRAFVLTGLDQTLQF